MAWLQLTVRTSADQAEYLEDTLLNLGALSITFSDDADQPILEPAMGETPLWNHSAITALFQADIDCPSIDKTLGQTVDNYPNLHRWEMVEDKDWEREWMRHYHPIDCGGDLWICPSWLPPPKADATNVLLDPGLAFGTGTHPTTLLCLQWLARPEVIAAIRGQTLIDYGCGSGILGIAALKLGADKVIAVDIDPQALLATQENARRNHIDPESIETYLPDRAPQLPVSLVFANILAGPLINLAPQLMGLTVQGGFLCLSGILGGQGESVLAAYRANCQLHSRREQDQWLQLALLRQ
jgi:ribosomal protein L11 methyltransferase